jgi:DNA-binding response OmpR family regulator
MTKKPDSIIVKILVVEDNRDIAENIADYFEPLGHTLDFAIDGAAGVKLATEESFDIIVLDLMLPRLNGMEACRQLRGIHHIHTPILMLTAKDQLDDKLEGFSAGADDYLVKPFSVKELEARLLALLKRTQGKITSRILRVSDLEYNLDTRQASRGNNLLELNPILRGLLELLMKKSPSLVTRHEMETAIWGDDPPDKDILRTHVYNLRTIIDKPFSKKLLHTVHGAGYRLAE